MKSQADNDDLEEREPATAARRRKRRVLLASTTAAFLALAVGVAAALGWFSHTSEGPNCVAMEGLGNCREGRALNGAMAIALSADGKNAYVAGGFSDAVAILDRDAVTGSLTQKGGTAGCVSESGTTVSDYGTKTACQNGRGLGETFGLAVSPDGKNVYVTGVRSSSIAVFDRDRETGELTQKRGTAGCISESGSKGACQDGVGLGGARGIAVSPDGRNVYVAGGGGISVFDRDPLDGALSQPGGGDACIAGRRVAGPCRTGRALGALDVEVSPDGHSVYAVSTGSDAVAILKRDPITGTLTQAHGPSGCVSEDGTQGCQDGKALREPFGLAVSPDGKNVYVAAEKSNAIAIFDRDSSTGALTQQGGITGCVSEGGTEGACGDGRGLEEASDAVVSPDGRDVYVVSAAFNGGVAIFSRNIATGALTQKTNSAGCIAQYSEKDICRKAEEILGLAVDGALSPDGKEVYAVSPVGAVSVLVPGALPEETVGPR
jgi:DNA-binding beta-propeller fold protein YncE